jgi:sporulation protein YlmC with PRC-barrel domain
MKRLLISTAIVGLAALPTFAIAQSDQDAGAATQSQTESQTDMGTGTQGDMKDGTQAGTDMDATGGTGSTAGKATTDSGKSAGSSADKDASGMTSGSDDMTAGDKASKDKAAGDMAASDKAPVSDGHSAVDPETVEASEIQDAAVMSRENEEIADVSDVLLTEDGSIDAIVVNVGGVLGMGSKPVKVPFDRLTLQTNDEDGEMSIVIPMSQKELEDMPRYEEAS